MARVMDVRQGTDEMTPLEMLVTLRCRCLNFATCPVSAQERVYFRPGQGYSCYDLNDDTNLRITPSLFLPEEWCACMAWLVRKWDNVCRMRRNFGLCFSVGCDYFIVGPCLVILLKPQGLRWENPMDPVGNQGKYLQ